MTHIIIDGDACPVVDSIIDLTTETGIFVKIIGASAIFRTNYILHMYQHYMLMMNQMQLITKLFNYQRRMIS